MTLQCKTFELQTMMSLLTEAARLRQEFSEVRNKVERRDIKFARLEDGEYAISEEDKVDSKLLSSVKKTSNTVLQRMF